jgi:hypothetical protein
VVLLSAALCINPQDTHREKEREEQRGGIKKAHTQYTPTHNTPPHTIHTHTQNTPTPIRPPAYTHAMNTRQTLEKALVHQEGLLHDVERVAQLFWVFFLACRSVRAIDAVRALVGPFTRISRALFMHA